MRAVVAELDAVHVVDVEQGDGDAAPPKTRAVQASKAAFSGRFASTGPGSSGWRMPGPFVDQRSTERARDESILQVTQPPG